MDTLSEVSARNRTLEIMLDKQDICVEELEVGEYGDESEAIGRILMLCADRLEGGRVEDSSIVHASLQLAKMILDRCDPSYWESVDRRDRLLRSLTK